jgi:hypothetical protein
MTLSDRFRIIFAFILTCTIAGCQRDEPGVLPDVVFRFEVSESFLNARFQSVVIISDFNGNVLATEKLNHIGTHELVFPQEKDETYHVTIFDGAASFTTFAFLSPSTYALDFTERDYPGHAGTLSIFSQGLTVQPSGKHVSFYYNKSNSELELWLSRDSTDLFMYLEPFPFDEPRYLYMPVVKKGEAISVDMRSDTHKYSRIESTVQNTSGTNIFLFGDHDLDEGKMEYFLSRSGPYPAGPQNIDIPSVNSPQVEYYRTVFSSFDGHMYTSNDKQIATTQKFLTTKQSRLETGPSSVFYSIESDAVICEWSGFASISGISWRILSTPGINVKVNLPQFPPSFRNVYNLSGMETLKFSTVTLSKDSRFPSYLENVMQYYFRDQRNSVVPYETIQQSIILN